MNIRSNHPSSRVSILNRSTHWRLPKWAARTILETLHADTRSAAMDDRLRRGLQSAVEAICTVSASRSLKHYLVRYEQDGEPGEIVVLAAHLQSATRRFQRAYPGHLIEEIYPVTTCPSTPQSQH